MDELVIRPNFKVGDILWKQDWFSLKDYEQIEIENITIDYVDNCFLYHYSRGRYFKDSSIGYSIFETEDGFKNKIRSGLKS